MSWDAVDHNKQIWGYPVALECVSLVVNKKLVPGKPPAQLSEFPKFAKELKAKDPKVMAIMWDYKVPYFGFPFLASAGAYTFKRTESGYDIKDIGVDNAGAIEGLKMIVDLINAGVLPKGSTQNVGEQKMATGELATMVNGPWAWANLRKSGVDFDLAPFRGLREIQVGRSLASRRSFINRASPNADFAMQFIEKYVCTADGLKAIDADAPLGVPAVQVLADEMSAKDPLIKGTYENILNGVVMPNIPQMGKLWSSMKAAFETATNGEATPEAALRDARKNMEKITGHLSDLRSSRRAPSVWAIVQNQFYFFVMLEKKGSSPSLGVCYYPEHWEESRWPEDVRRMRGLGIKFVRVGEFAWSRFEPEPEGYDFGWLERFLGL